MWVNVIFIMLPLHFRLPPVILVLRTPAFEWRYCLGIRELRFGAPNVILIPILNESFSVTLPLPTQITFASHLFITANLVF